MVRYCIIVARRIGIYCIVYITDARSDGRGDVHAPGRLKLDVSIFSNLVMEISGGLTVSRRDARISAPNDVL